MEEALRISGIGIFIVFFALVFISVILSLIGKVFTAQKNNSHVYNKEKQKNTINEDNIKNNDEITPEIIAVITAAVQVAYGKCTRIHSIGSIHHESQYKMQGRMNIMSSHKLK